MATNTLTLSVGLKRKISSFLTILLGFTSTIPYLAPVTLLLQQVAGIIGAVGIGHATVANSWDKKLLISAASALAAFAALARWVPALAPYAAVAEQLALILGSLGVGATIVK